MRLAETDKNLGLLISQKAPDVLAIYGVGTDIAGQGSAKGWPPSTPNGAATSLRSSMTWRATASARAMPSPNAGHTPIDDICCCVNPEALFAATESFAVQCVALAQAAADATTDQA